MNWCTSKGMKLLYSGVTELHLQKIFKKDILILLCVKLSILTIPRIVLRFESLCYTSVKICYTEQRQVRSIPIDIGIEKILVGFDQNMI